MLQQMHSVLFWNTTSVIWVPVAAKARAKTASSYMLHMRHYRTPMSVGFDALNSSTKEKNCETETPAE